MDGSVQLRGWYAAELQPRLTGLQPKDIVRVIDVSRVYARQVIAGQIPHAHHFAALAKLARVPAPKALRLAAMPAAAAGTLYERLQAGRKLSLDDYRLRLLQREEGGLRSGY
jgi:hypothetical protein